MIFHENRLLADDSYEISYLIFSKVGEDVAKFVVVVIGPLRVKSKPYNISCNYRSTSLSQSPREWRKYFEIAEVRHSQNVTSPKYSIHVEFR